MRLDLSKDRVKITKYLKKRVKDYPKYVNFGPGIDTDPIRFIALGFYAAQGGYISLVFDTRADGDYDGEYTKFLDEQTMLDFPKWCDFYELACDGHEVTLVTGAGATELVHFEDANSHECIGDSSEKRLNAYFGDMLRDVLVELKSDGTWSKLPLTDDAFMMVIDFDELYLWPNYKQRLKAGRVAN
jgi:hypothetical protein